MSFLTLSGIPLDIAEWSQDDDSPGSETRTVTGQIFKENTYERRQWSGTSKLLARSEADAIRSLIKGRGHHFGFEDTEYSDKGLGLEATPTFSATAKYGTKSATSGSDLEANFGATYATYWTVLVWKYVSSTWVHIAARSDGTLWDDGDTAGATEAAAISMASTGFLTLSAGQYDDLVVVPYEMPDAWVEAIAADTQAFSALPDLRLAGDCVGDQEIIVMGTEPAQPFTNDGTTGGKVAISFGLKEAGR